MSIKLTEQQSSALSILNRGENLFLTGPGGVGKTAVLKYFSNNYVGNIAITSTTGTSALLIKGTTLHSFLGIGLGKKSVNKLVQKILNMNWLYNRWRKLDCLVIDEISMMSPKLFDKLEEVARTIRNNENPFGGIHLVISGDWCQLPCIGTNKFCFEAKTWNKCISNVVYLEKIIRQGNQSFQKCLNAVRMGNITDEVKNMLNKRIGIQLDNNYGIKPTKLYAKNINVTEQNNIELDKLAKKGLEFNAYELTAEVPNNKKYMKNKFAKFCPVNKRIELCKGAQVMLAKNLDLSAGLANGSRGVVIDFTDKHIPIVKFLNGEERVIHIDSWEIEENNKIVCRLYQIPLRIAYALTIHRCQGCSLDYAEIDLSDIFEYGQAYVALSRLKSLQGLSIINIDYECIQVDPIAKSYYMNLVKDKKNLKIKERISVI